MKQKIDRVLFWSCGALAAAALFGIMWLTVVDVIGRKFFSNSVPGGLELTEIMMVCVIFAALPLVSWRGEHVVFDTFDRLISPRVRALQIRVVHVLCAVVFAWLAWLMVLKGMRFASYGETTSYLLLPLYPVSGAMAVLLLVTGVVHLVLAALGEADEGHIAHAVHQGETSAGGSS